MILVQDLLGREGGFGILHIEETEEEGTSSTGKRSAGLSSSRCILKDPQMDSPVEDSQGDSISVEAINYLGLCTTQLSKSDQGSAYKIKTD